MSPYALRASCPASSSDSIDTQPCCDTLTMNVLSTAPSDWQLIAEGGANLVLSYSGNDAAFSSLVLRVRKRKLHAVSTSEDEEDPAVAFNEQVVEQLMPGLSASLWNATVDEAFLQALAELVEPHRRPARRLEDELDTKRKRVVRAEDLVSPRSGEKVLTVEIKVVSRTLCIEYAEMIL